MGKSPGTGQGGVLGHLGRWDVRCDKCPSAGLTPLWSTGTGAALAAKPPHGAMPAVCWVTGRGRSPRPGQAASHGFTVLPHWQWDFIGPRGQLHGQDPLPQPWDSPFPALGICSLSHSDAKSLCLAHTIPCSFHVVSFLARPMGKNSREQRLCSGAGEFVSISSQ